MPCYHPLSAFRLDSGDISFNQNSRNIRESLTLPCGQCIGCRLERSRQWAVRMMHEASLYAENSFVTLTYSQENLPKNGSLVVADFQKFMKRLRKTTGKKIRFFHCGEYGESLGRPHYHACLFGYDFPDKTPWRKTSHGHQLWRSMLLEEIWPFGHSEIGSVTFESAAYVARYIMKKQTGKNSSNHYARSHAVTGEVYYLQPEYTTMSRRPGIAAGWFQKFSGDVYPSDEVITNARSCKPPRYYDRQFEILDPESYEDVKEKRLAKAKNNSDNSKDRLRVKEQVATARLKNLPRQLT